MRKLSENQMAVLLRLADGWKLREIFRTWPPQAWIINPEHQFVLLPVHSTTLFSLRVHRNLIKFVPLSNPLPNVPENVHELGLTEAGLAMVKDWRTNHAIQNDSTV